MLPGHFLGKGHWGSTGWQGHILRTHENDKLLLGEGVREDFMERVTSGLNFDENQKMPAFQAQRIVPLKVT